eukprot:NODE_68_length_25399_cov_0.885771.p1 type:complete len:1150 gc:universal NODE_68_length_25399_cov_0.885771:13080-16529(+)
MGLFSAEDKKKKSGKPLDTVPIPQPQVLKSSLFEGDPLSVLLTGKNIAGMKTRMDSLNDINYNVDIFGNTPLHLAISMRDITLIIFLLQKGADIDACNFSGKTPWDLAAAIGDENILGLLLLFNPDSHSITIEFEEILKKAEDARGRFIYQKISLYGNLENSCSLGNLEEVTIKLQNREMVDNKDKNGVTLLMRACHRGHLNLALKLIDWGAMLDTKDKYGWNSLSYAIYGGHLDIVKFILEQRKSNFLGDSAGNDPIVIASYQGFYHILTYLQSKFDILSKSKYTSKALMIAAWRGHTMVVQFLKSRKISSGESSANNWVVKGCQFVDKFQDHFTLIDGLKKPYKTIWIAKMTQLVNENNDNYSKRDGLLSHYMIDKNDDYLPNPLTPPCGRLLRTYFSGVVEVDFLKEELIEKKAELFQVDENYQGLMISVSQRLSWCGTWLDEEYFRILNKFKLTIEHVNSEDRAKLIVLSTEVKDIIEDAILKTDKMLDMLKTDKTGYLLMVQSPIFQKIKDACRKVDEDDLNDLLKKTKLVSGVWPPPLAKKEFIASLAHMMGDFGKLVDLINTTGILNMFMLKMSDRLKKTSSNYNINVAEGDYKNYKQKQYLQIQNDVNEQSLNKDEAKDPDAPFVQRLEYLVAQFVVAVKTLRSSTDLKFEGEINRKLFNAGSQVHSACDAIVDEVIQYDLFSNPDILNKNELSTALKTQVSNIRLDVLKHGQQVMANVNEMVKFCQLSSGKWPPPDAKNALLYSLSPVATGLKELVDIAKAGAVQIRQLEQVVLEKLDKWQKAILQTQRMSKIFQFWDQDDQIPVTSEKDYWDQTLEEKTQMNKDGLVLTDSLIKGGRLTKLLEYLTHPTKNDIEFMHDFFMSCKTFTQPTEILDLLVIKYDTPPPMNLSENQFIAFMKKHVAPMRLRIANIIKFWLELYFVEDFESDEAVLTKLKQFINVKLSKDYAKHAHEIGLLIKSHEDGTWLLPENSSEKMEMPKPLVTKKFTLSYLTNDPKTLLEIDPIEMARQLSLIEYSLFYKIQPREAINQVYADTSGKEINLYPNIFKMIQFTNQVTMWVCSTLVSIKEIKSRVLMMKYFMSIAIACKEIQNFNALTAIVAGLTMGPVFRLKKTLAKLEKGYPKIKEVYTETVNIVSPKG